MPFLALKKYSPIAAILTVALYSFLYSSGPAIVGGERMSSPGVYAILVRPNGELVNVYGANLPASFVTINSVAINSFGTGMIGGKNESDGSAYAALVASNGKLTQLFDATFPSTDGVITSVAINNSGSGIIGGQNGLGTVSSYAALVFPNQVLTTLSDTTFPSTNGVIRSVAINSSGAGVIGGQQDENSGPAYAALVSPTGMLTNLSDATFPSTNGSINSVAINDSGWGLIGGQDQNQNLNYAAVISPTGDLIPLSGDHFPSNMSDRINSVAINNARWGIIGGSNTNGYAALVTPNNTLIELFEGGIDPSLTVSSVDINSSGTAIIGGKDLSGPELPYAAFVAQDGTLTRITGSAISFNTKINSVAINDAGVAIIGGQLGEFDPAYAALVAPNGAITNLLMYNPNSNQETNIFSVAISDEFLETTVPKSFGPGSSFANAIFPLTSQVLPNHAMYHHKASYNQPHADTSSYSDVGLLVDATDVIRSSMPCLQAAHGLVWFTPFGAYAHQKEDQNFVALTNWIGGGMLGFDYRGIRDAVIGIGGAYAYNHVNYAQNAGRASFHQGFFTLYGSWNRKNFFVSAALWGGYYRLHNKRTTLNIITSTARVNGWQLTAHLELSTPFHPLGPHWFVIDPFIMTDWVSNWQGSVKELGSAGLNICFDSTYTSLLRTEIGLRFFESISYRWGALILQQKASFINKVPFQTQPQNAAFVASASSFNIDVFSNRTQNLGAVQLSTHLVPHRPKYPYGALHYQGEFGSSFQSHLILFEIGKYF